MIVEVSQDERMMRRAFEVMDGTDEGMYRALQLLTEGSGPFSLRVPRLLQAHLAHLRASSLSTDVIMERGYESVLGKKQLADLGFSPAQRRTSGILMPVYGPDGPRVGYQYRPDHPRVDARGRPIKYENPAGSSIRLDVPPRCREHLGNPAIPLFFTEGIKKGDALATQGACAVDLTGVWGFKGGNPFGGTTISADFDYIALKDRENLIVYDSDYRDKPGVRLAAERLSEHLTRKGSKLKLAYLPSGPDGEKVGVDDYFAQGHNLDDLVALADKEAPPPPPPQKVATTYIIEDGRLCWARPTFSGQILTAPLCNFTASVVEEIVKDDGFSRDRYFAIEGKLAVGRSLPRVQVPAGQFSSMSWVGGSWGVGAIIAAGNTAKDRLREAIQMQSQAAPQRQVFAHSGWREVDGKRGFLTAAGALGLPGVEVELESPLQRYRLPLNPGPDDIRRGMEASLDLLNIGKAEVVVPLWAAMYLAPLSEILDPAFTLWLVGPTGAFKSTVQALALSHFGKFGPRSLPASWGDSANYLEKQMALSKDLPLVVDDWAPATDTKQAREYEAKAEQVARAQGNRRGRGRLRSDTSTRPPYIPRGVVITSGEQLPGGQSHGARLFSSEIEHGDISRDALSLAQEAAKLYPFAMSGYILWLSSHWPDIERQLPLDFEHWRRQFQNQAKGQHPRIPEAAAWLYLGFDTAMTFAQSIGVLTEAEAQERRDSGLVTLIQLGDAQGGRIEEERPGRRFLVGLKALIDDRKVILPHKDEEVTKISPFETHVGWRDPGQGLLLLNPPLSYKAVCEFWRSGQPFTFKPRAVWADLIRMKAALPGVKRPYTASVWVGGKSEWVVCLREDALKDI